MTQNTTDPRRRLNAAAAPALIIRLELESRPRVIVEVREEQEKDRLFDWLRAQRDLSDLALCALDAVEIRKGPSA